MLLQECRRTSCGVGLVFGLVFAFAGCAATEDDDSAWASYTWAETSAPAPVPTTRRLAVEFEVVLDPTVSDGLAAGIVEALYDWQKRVEAAGCPMAFRLHRGPTRPFSVQLSDADLPPAGVVEVRASGDHGTDYGYAHSSPTRGSFVEFQATTFDDAPTFDWTLRHELGHAFRLGHDDAHLAVMAQTGFRTSPRVTCSDVAAFVGVWCPEAAAETCEAPR